MMVKFGSGSCLAAGLFLVVAMLSGCEHSDNHASAQKSSEPEGQSIVDTKGLSERVFAGTLPCNEKDCTAIDMQVTLRSTPDNKPGNFVNVEKYKNGKTVTRVVTMLGLWRVVDNPSNNKGVAVYQIGSLNNHPLMFELINDNTLRLISTNQQSGNNGQDYDLTLQDKK